MDGWSHYNCSIVCVVCVGFTTCMLLDDTDETITNNFSLNFDLIVFIMLIYAIIEQNIINNIDPCNEKMLILQFINCKLNENVMRPVIFNNDVELGNIIILQLLDYLFSLLVGLSIIVKRIMCYYAKKLSKLIRYYIPDIMFTLTIQNGACNYLYSIPNHTQSEFDSLRQVCLNSDYNSCGTIIFVYKLNQYDNNCQYYHNSIIVRSQISNGECTGRILFGKIVHKHCGTNKHNAQMTWIL